MNLNKDAFSHGQIESKIWLCEHFERIKQENDVVTDTIYLLAGWYGMLAHLLHVRSFQFNKIKSFDIDPGCKYLAEELNNALIVENKFEAISADVNKLNYKEYPNVVINTSTEHFKDQTWFTNIYENTFVIIQSNNMPHWDHHNTVESTDELIDKYPLNRLLFKGAKRFIYPDKDFYRYMIMGYK